MVKEMSLVSVGIGVFCMGFALVVIGTLLHAGSQQKAGKDGSAKFSFVGFIGPFPFGFGNDKQLLTITFIVAIALFLVMMFLFSGGLRGPRNTPPVKTWNCRRGTPTATRATTASCSRSAAQGSMRGPSPSPGLPRCAPAATSSG